ncbi:hypothetical protein E8E12_000671 [Didymella heteroderae]|uniref:F-box domain-containing protein n=1 Tax=Didymella heteroderae TaxID=1769908 RepID=A0A9P4WIL4_9PLEO|nr:hypothetical protein E8E12_000671 [Didymella heteroderae]
MSSRPDSDFLTLPPELIENITRQVAHKRDLAGMRTTCKTLNKPAANELFKFVYISPSEKDLGTWNSISEHDVIRRIPRHVVIYTQSDVEDHGAFSNDRERDEIGKDFKSALAALSRYPNLDSVSIKADHIGTSHTAYVVFDNGILPTHWPEAEDDGELYTWLEDEDGFPNLHETCLEEDQKSLDRLMEKIRSRR